MKFIFSTYWKLEYTFFAASCLSYGHSCWGAHGKRSGPPHVKPDQEDTDILNNRWELIKIFKDKVGTI